MTAPAVVTEAPAVSAAPPVIPVVAPVVAPPVVESAAPVAPAKPEGPLSRREAKTALQESLRQRAAAPAEPVVAPEGRSPDAVSVEAKVPGASETPKVATSPVETLAPPGPASPAAAPAAPQPIRVPIPVGHALREQGLEFLTAHSPVEERALYAVLNSYTRRQEVATLQAKVDEYQRRETERAAREAAEEQWKAKPEYNTIMAQAQELRETHGDAVADQFLRGFNADFDKMARQEIEARMGEIDQQRIAEAGERWTNEARTRVLALPESIRALPIFNEVFNKAVQSFNSELGLGHYDDENGVCRLKNGDEMHQEFFRFLNARLRAQPEVTALVNAVSVREEQGRTAAAARAAEEQRRIEKIRLDAVEDFKRQEAAKRTAMPPHPLGNLAAVSRDRLPAGSEAAEPAANVPINQLRRDARAAAAERAKQRFGMT